jgi:hypothetical protein
MTQKNWFDLGPSLLLAVGVVVSTLIAVLAAKSGWLVLAGPLCLALSVVGADVMASRLRGEQSPRPSWPALLLGATFLVVGWIVALRDPNLVKMFILSESGVAWAVLLMRPKGRRYACSFAARRS